MTFPAHHLLVHESCRKLTDISTFTFSNPEKWSDINWLFQKHCWWIYLRHYTICFGCFLPWLLYNRIQNIELFISKDALIYILKRFWVYIQLFRLVRTGVDFSMPSFWSRLQRICIKGKGELRQRLQAHWPSSRRWGGRHWSRWRGGREGGPRCWGGSGEVEGRGGRWSGEPLRYFEIYGNWR